MRDPTRTPGQGGTKADATIALDREVDLTTPVELRLQEWVRREGDGAMTLELPGHFPNGNMPRYATDGAAGADISASADIVLPRGARALVPTGIRLAIPNGFEGQIRPRSGLAFKHGITVLNAPGTIDSDYRGEIKILLVNLGEHEYTVRVGDRIAQLVITPIVRVRFNEAVIPESDRGAGGFGSTGL